MEIPNVAEKWTSSVNEITIGATKEEGGTREKTVTIGGSKCIPFMDFDGSKGHKPVIAMDVYDISPDDWPETLKKPFADVLDNPAQWAKKCVEYGADLICLKLEGIHPDKGNKSAAETVDVAKSILAAVGVPLIIWGCEHDEKDNEILPKVSQALKGENCLIGVVTQDNYKTLTVTCLADGHSIITLSPVDINIAKQVNILVSEMDFPLKRIVMFQTTGALGYGMEYTYSIQERERIAALTGDKLMAMPVICDVGHEAWRAKEAKSDDKDAPQWGPREERGPMWETITATSLLQSGVDIIRMNHPKAVAAVKKCIDRLY
ncbi:corrinoid/iron-sulfur protein small subunit [Candidatus Kuenenia stuttgartiensis]|jgi:acetyl-CoA decarbonylase/synthase complex subunit delta|uniref:Corrinoid/iron-sulfur protein small subunit n=1 Tax=Kuenenia stuttgartiensis TaxID=174633 RepID=Q1PYX6_KUEST|nr:MULTISPECIES: acetyl-CoA decarbonylase/synthase complex subunit delta [Kuenenia]MBE7547447.1 acetyl-CoA decarbonylase/synthase complex subunit delta [Planctomycetia bacterium]MBW7943369.1 acetyl-CoA decarbonylase/synthase complex subunit delta [Candidatus Kuenenia stuttgartiensis]MBZ0192789.1 acetyl-CoA decarbonylase/synthase complex subunit delta [Candidatus Kuenenia stuttgartiensis]MCF6152890.1 acetyl-CoA decarbonylase/synthase complex subunit delta [Candidatus Kuenenia stuttgartiensis]MC